MFLISVLNGTGDISFENSMNIGFMLDWFEFMLSKSYITKYTNNVIYHELQLIVLLLFETNIK